MQQSPWHWWTNGGMPSIQQPRRHDVYVNKRGQTHRLNDRRNVRPGIKHSQDIEKLSTKHAAEPKAAEKKQVTTQARKLERALQQPSGVCECVRVGEMR